MDRIVLLVSLASDWIADRVGDVFHAPFWKVMGGAVIVTLSVFAVFAVSAAPTAGKDKIKLIALFGALGFAAFDLVRPFERGFPLG